MVRAKRADAEDLDTELVLLQEAGGTITQVLPCPVAVNMEEWEDRKGGNGLTGEIEMYFMIIYHAKD